MLEKLSNSILHEAGMLLKKQNNHDNDKFGASFEELFEIKNFSAENSKAGNAEAINEIPNSNIISDKNELYAETTGKSEFSDNNISKEVKKDNFENKAKNSSENNSIEKDLKADKANNKKGLNENKSADKNADELNIELYANLKLNNLAYKNLNVSEKEKIKNIIRELKAGIINENTARIFIDQVVKAVNLNRAQKPETNRIKNDSKDSGSNGKFQVKNLFGEKDSLESKTVKVNDASENKNSQKFANAVKKQLSDILKGEIEQSRENKGLDINSKEFKFDINLVINENRANAASQPKITNARILEQNRASLFHDIAKNTKIVLSQNQTNFSTMIRPENFGRIDLNFIAKDGKLNGRMILQTQEVADFFRANVEEFKAVMQKSNVELENLEIILAGNRFAENNNSKNNNESLNQDLTSVNSVFDKKIENIFESNNALFTNNYSKQKLSKVNLIV